MHFFRTPCLFFLLFLGGCATTSDHSPQPPLSAPSEPTVSQLPQHKASQSKPSPSEVILLKPHQHNDVWQRIRSQLAFEPTQHKKVQARVDWYMSHPNYMDVISVRAAPFLHYVVEQVERRGLPIELALMPLIESDFNTSAYSHKHASGLWQLTPLIAKHYGVKISPWYDGRQDIVDATNAALDFLSYLHQRFDGNWYHAIAAYNTGEGRVAQAIKKNKRRGKSSDFFALSLPKQTRHYVPKLLAAAQLLREQKMKFPIIANRKAISVLTLKQGVILNTDKQWQKIQTLNPGYTRFPALLDGPKHIVLPVEQVKQWQGYLAKLPAMPSSQWQQYTINRGDSLSVIAARHALSVAQLKTFNQLKSNNIRAGDTLLLPILADQQLDYTVRAGDSLWRIANHFNVSISDIKKWNALSKDMLRIGDKLTLFLSNS
ncbi:Membrane-bound lytic murein transglycosylase D [Pseudoalteromonas holothuriae]|uniref:Membrane-bound lytic murein transglycosylase D n=1 Tax=Pseudoalteromonas holothuriae TaxID=2963714 RepID=A0A9W4QZG6_9GAMM|nr:MULTISPECIES: LysM peptidoglycan-binding domain-containing protein [unclassified Pseudoalteromonas]CAH9060242.1 Membrane-bound lytic murein transglycosylase D [Pseudoalteromonas sp. CIP111854]CAH9063434.1 Membrane-bound lytic murein transglycosylase D [Pseudoalteromonas sp. CIP111951]